MWGLTFYGEVSAGLRHPPALRAGLAAPGAAVPLLQAGDPQAAVRVGLEAAPLRVVAGLEREGVGGGGGPPAASPPPSPPPAPPTPYNYLRPLQPHQPGVPALARPPPGPGDHGQTGLCRGGGELPPHHRPHLALPDPVILLLHPLDQEGAGVGGGGGADPPILPSAASPNGVDGLVGRLPQADGGVDAGPAGHSHHLPRAADDLRWSGRHSQARPGSRLQDEI